jgi:tRNA A37 threonylcarbamoyltransferase TsaD
LARGGDPKAYALPKPLAKTQDAALRTGCDFSFAGLKSAVRPTPTPSPAHFCVDNRVTSADGRVASKRQRTGAAGAQVRKIAEREVSDGAKAALSADEFALRCANLAASFQAVAVEHLVRRVQTS